LNFSADTNGFTDQPTIPAPVPEYGPVLYVAYLVQAHYSGGDSPWSETVWLDDPRRSVSANIVRGPQGRTYLILSTIPESTVALRLSRVDTHVYPNVVTNFDIAIANVTNGVYQLPESWSPPLGKAYQWFIQTVDVNDQFSDAIGPQFNEPIPFFDGRQQLKQNLIFQLRSAGLEESFGYRSIGDPETYFWEWRFSYPTDYAYASFYELDDYYGYPDAYQREFLPFRENYIYRNFAFNTTNMTDSGWLDTGVAWEMVSGYFSGLKLVYPPSYEFQTPTDENAITALLSPSESQWICWPYFYPASAYTDFWQAIGIGLQNSNFVMTAGARNIFGLPYVSAKLAYPSGGSVAFATLEAGGGSLTAHTGYFYPATAQPEFQTVGYYFGQPTLDWLPGHNGFSPTNTTPLMITSVGGRGLWIAGYAKLAVINGYNGVYAYLGQYFDKAYLCDANGQVTTNETGILSPYGEFLPTMPGTVAMVTMPENADNTGPRGTNIVHVIKLQLDVNHDGQMDLSLAGQDDTSAGRPFTFWVNNDHDEPANYNQPDRDLPVSKSKPDYNYGEIRCQRNLEDFARLWIVGLPPIPGFSGYEVTLSWRNTNGAPAINLYGAFDGGTGYLTDTNTAATQIILAGDKLGTVNSTPLTLSDLYFSPASDKYGFLFEGTNTGSGELVMTFSKNGQALAETSQWIDLHDVKDFYERAVITNNISSSAISNWTSGVEIVQPATASALGDDKDIIVLVHGINVDDNAWLIESDTVFKRLYWAGYHGKFATVKWPCNFLTPPQPVTFDVFNLSEAKAYKSSQALTNYLNQLHARFPDHRLHLLLHSQGNAVVSEALARSGVPVDTYILTQGAIVASAYDVNASIYQPFVDKEVGLGITPEWQPWGYRGIYTNLTGRIVNFYNPQDGVLAIWKIDQIDDKPGKYTYDGTNCWYVDFFFIKHLVTDQQEARAMVARARTLSIGQSGPESAHGVIQSAVDLNVQFGFNSDVSEHSAQWTRPIQTSWGYYDEILGACLIPTIQR
jgi:pimeloyl-ACP methyl ester carboxylesterase